MNQPHDPHEPRDERELARLLHAAVDDVEPSDRLGSIRARTTRRAPAGARRSWPLALAGAVAVAAVAAGAVSLPGLLGGPGRDDPGPAASRFPTEVPAEGEEPTPVPGLPTPPVEPSATTPPPGRTADQRPTTALPVYYLVDTDRAGPRLVREFRRGEATRRLEQALGLLTGPALDPDYRTAWPAGAFLGAGFDGTGDAGQFGLVVAQTALDRPAGMSDQEARAGIEQVVRTLQGVAQAAAPVRFVLADGTDAPRVLGVPLAGPVERGSTLELLNHLNLTSPEQGQVVSSGTLRVRGVANSFEASVYWEVRQGEAVLLSGPGTAGWAEDRLYPFAEDVDVSGLPPGEYTLWATTSDPTGGTEGVGAMTDTKEFTIR